MSISEIVNLSLVFIFLVSGVSIYVNKKTSKVKNLTFVVLGLILGSVTFFICNIDILINNLKEVFTNFGYDISYQEINQYLFIISCLFLVSSLYFFNKIKSLKDGVRLTLLFSGAFLLGPMLFFVIWSVVFFLLLPNGVSW